MEGIRVKGNGFLTWYALWLGFLLVFLSTGTTYLAMQYLKQVPYRKISMQLEYDVFSLLSDCIAEIQGKAIGEDKTDFLARPVQEWKKAHPEQFIYQEHTYQDPHFNGYPIKGEIHIRLYDTKNRIGKAGTVQTETRKNEDGTFHTVIISVVRR